MCLSIEGTPRPHRRPSLEALECAGNGQTRVVVAYDAPGSILLVVDLGFASLSDRASAGDLATVGKIKELLEKYEVSIDKIDLNLANQVWSHSPEVIFIEPRGTERGLSAIEETFYEQTMGDTFSQRQLLIESPAIHVYGNTAWGEFTWTFHATTRNGGKQMTLLEDRGLRPSLSR